jgi:hypothetical protein
VCAVRSHSLETALRTFVEEAALRLQADLDAGAEVPFELASPARRGRAQLYCYRPLTDAFLRERWPELQDLESYAPAAQLLEGYEGLERYLLAREEPLAGAGQPPGGRRAPRRERRPTTRADAALRLLLGEVFAEHTDFSLREERLAGALARLDCLAYPGATEVTLVATLHGLAITSPELPLARGLTLMRPEELPDAPEGAALGSPSALLSAPAPAAGHAPSREQGHLVVAYTTEDSDPLAAFAHGREVLGRLLRALRLFGDGRLTLGRLAWARVGAGAWGALALPWGGRPHGMLVVNATQEDELRAFCSLVSRRAPREGELAWALARFEMGCERATDSQALSDYLLALRALLEPEAPSGGKLPGRLAALCATPSERAALTRRVARALALERAVVTGTAAPDARSLALVRELASHLGALLRDVICGHLRSDLASLADELLAAPEPTAQVPGPESLALRGAGPRPEPTAQARGAGPRPEPTAQARGAGPRPEPTAQGRGAGPRHSGQEDPGDTGQAGEILNVPV